MAELLPAVVVCSMALKVSRKGARAVGAQRGKVALQETAGWLSRLGPWTALLIFALALAVRLIFLFQVAASPMPAGY